MHPDPFDEILGLEEQFYDEGYQQGMADGVKVGRIEARTMGLVNGFEKYVESARLHGKSLIWANRLPKSQKATSNLVEKKDEPSTSDSTPELSVDKPVALALPPLSDNARLAKHIKVIYALAESDSLSTDNSDEAVSDFDDRLKRAQAKAKIIERMAGETDLAGSAKGGSFKDGGIEDALNARH